MWIVISLLSISWLYPLWLYLVRSTRAIKIVNIACSLLIWSLCWYGLYYIQQTKGVLYWTLWNSWITLTLSTPGVIFALMISTLWLLNLPYSFCYMYNAHSSRSHRCFFIWFSLSLASTMLLAFSGNLIVALLGYELLTVSTIRLVGYKQNERSIQAMNVYIRMLFGSSLLFLLPVLVYTYNYNEYNIMIIILLLLGVAKAAIFPMHQWLPKAMVAPVPVSSFLHAIAVVKSGIFLLYRFLQELDPITRGMTSEHYFGLQIWLLFSILYATYRALKQDNLKLRLAFSTIQQLNLMALMLISGHYQTIEYVMYYMISHGFAKLTLFSCVGYIYLVTRKTNLTEIKGLGRSMPIITIVFTIAAASVIGLPFTAGFWGKKGLLYHLQYTEFIVPFLSVMCVSAASFLNFSYILYNMLSQPSSDCLINKTTNHEVLSSVKHCFYVIIIGGLMCIVLAVGYDWLIRLMHVSDDTDRNMEQSMKFVYADHNYNKNHSNFVINPIS